MKTATAGGSSARVTGAKEKRTPAPGRLSRKMMLVVRVLCVWILVHPESMYSSSGPSVVPVG